MTSSVQSGATTTYTYAGATQNELLSESTSGGQSYTYTYGRGDSNELPEIEATKVGSNTAYLNHDNTGLPVMLQTNTSPTKVPFGRIEHVLQIPELDIFDGLAVATDSGLRFVDRDQVATITTDNVLCTILPEKVRNLPKPEGDEIYTADPDQDQGESLTAIFGRMFRRAHWVRKSS